MCIADTMNFLQALIEVSQGNKYLIFDEHPQTSPTLNTLGSI